MRSTTWLLAAAALAAAALLAGCTTIECGPGTIEENGVCVVADGTTPEADSCGDGTHYDEELLTCVPDLPPTECGPNTSPSVNEDGVIVCVGTGGSGCGGSIACPSPTSPKVTVCGQLYDLENNQPLQAEGATGAACDPANPTADGPCSLSLQFYDPLRFVGAPTMTDPQPSDEVVVDDCGRYRGVNVKLELQGFLAVATDDAAGDATYILTGIAFSMVAGEKLENVRAFVTRHSTDEMWTESAGNPFGADVTFSQRGVYVPTFRHGADPVAGVKITVNGQIHGDSDYYFSDEDPSMKTTIDPALDMTGANGAGLLVDSSLTMHSGVGAEPDGCMWPSNLAATIRNVVFAQDRVAEIEGMVEVPCP